MKDARLIFALLSSLPLLSGCGGEDIAVPEDTETRAILIAGPQVDEASTKGHDARSTYNIDDMRIWASFSPTTFSSSTPIGNWIDGGKAERQTDNSFVTTIPFYWPLIDGTLSFFAYTPYNSPTVVASGQAGSMVITYTPEAVNVTNQLDFCVSRPILNAPRTTDSLRFHFQHTLTYIQFFAKYSDPDSILSAGGYDLKIDQIDIIGVKGSRDAVILPQTTNFISWTDNAASATPVTYQLTRAAAQVADMKVDSTVQNFTYLNGRLYLLPQKLSGARLGVTYSLVKIVNQSETTIAQFYEEADIPTNTTDDEWKISGYVVYVLTIDVTNMKRLGVQAAYSNWIVDWDQQGTTPNFDIE